MKIPLQIEIVIPCNTEGFEYIKRTYDQLCNDSHFSFSGFTIASEDNQPQDYPEINELIQYLHSLNSAIELVSNIKSLKKISPINLQQLHIAVDVHNTHNILRLESEEDIDYMKKHALSWAINAVNTRHTTLDHHDPQNIKNKDIKPWSPNALISGGRVFLHNKEYFLQNEKNSGCFQISLQNEALFPCCRAASNSHESFYGMGYPLKQPRVINFNHLRNIIRSGNVCVHCDISKQYQQLHYLNHLAAQHKS